MNKTDSIQRRILARVEEGPGLPAISFPGVEPGVEWVTREEFYARSRRFGSFLNAAGLNRQEVCLIILPSDEFSSTVLMSVLGISAVPLLMAPPFIQAGNRYSSLRSILRGVIEKADPKLIICSDLLKDEISAISEIPTERILSETDCAGEQSAAIDPVFPNEADTAGLQLTSGTTGHPRICVWKQQGVLEALDGMHRAMRLDGGDICLNWTPLYHDMGLVNNFLLCLTAGIPLAMLSPQLFVRQPSLWLRKLWESRATVTWSPNFGFAVAAQRTKDDQLDGVRLDRVRAFWNAAERVHLETMQAFYQRFAPYGLRFEALKTNFGCAENVGGATFSDADGLFRFERIDSEFLWRRGVAKALPSDHGRGINVVGVGRAYPGLEVSIVSDEGRKLQEGQIGEIVLKTPSRLSCYLADPEATERTIRNGDLYTGDLGYLRDGELFWVGRVKERINVRGKKLDPSDFEPILLNIPGLRKGCFVAFGIDDPEQGTQRVVLIAEMSSEDAAETEEIRNRIANESLTCLGVNLSEIRLVGPNTLAKTSSGKRRHQHFRNLYLDGFFKSDSIEELEIPGQNSRS